MQYRAAGMLFCLMLSTACAGSDSGRADTIPEDESSATSKSAGALSAPTIGTLTKAEAKAAMLTVKDMPTGYAARPVDADSEDDDTGCAQLDNQADTPPGTTIDLERDFGQSDTGPFFAEVLQVMPGKAEKNYDAIAGAFKKCRTFTLKEDGVTVQGKLSALSFPKLGDETFGFQMVLSNIPFYGSVTADWIMVRLGPDMLTGFIATQLAGPPDAETLEKLTRKGIGRIVRQASE